jgi:hypothetical protein
MKRLQGLNKHRGEMYKAELLARLRSKTKKSSNKPKLAVAMGIADCATHAQEVAAATVPLAVASHHEMEPSTTSVSTKPNNVVSSSVVTKQENGAAASTAVEGETSKSSICIAIKTERLGVDEKVEVPASDTGSPASDAMASDPPVRIQTEMTVDMDSSAVISPSPDDSLDYHSMDPSAVASSETGASADETRVATNGNGVMVVPSNNDKQNSTMSKLDVENLISARVAAEAAAIMDNASDSEHHLSPPPLSAPPSPLTAA